MFTPNWYFIQKLIVVNKWACEGQTPDTSGSQAVVDADATRSSHVRRYAHGSRGRAQS